MEEIVAIDTNIIIRFLCKDNLALFVRAKEVFASAEQGEKKIYLDEIVAAEAVWVLSSFYKLTRGNIAARLKEFVLQSWVINLRKELILAALGLYAETNLSYADCWIAVVSKKVGARLETFDRALAKIASLGGDTGHE